MTYGKFRYQFIEIKEIIDKLVKTIIEGEVQKIL